MRVMNVINDVMMFDEISKKSMAERTSLSCNRIRSTLLTILVKLDSLAAAAAALDLVLREAASCSSFCFSFRLQRGTQ